MLTIGEFARRGRVTVRMLRHYDAIGLLPPAHIDPNTRYRFYESGQLSQLTQIVAFKNLGFTLDRVQAILHDGIGTEELCGMLRLRRAELHAQIVADSARLARVEAKLRSVGCDGAVPIGPALPARYIPDAGEPDGLLRADQPRRGDWAIPRVTCICQSLNEHIFLVLPIGLAGSAAVPESRGR